MQTGQLILMIAAFCLLLVPSRIAPGFFLGAALLIPRGALFTAGDFSLLPLKVLVLFGLLRMVFRREYPIAFPQKLDRAFIAFSIIFVFTGFFHTDPKAEFIYRVGMTMEWVGGYFVMRALVREWDDVTTVFCGFAWVMLLLGCFMLLEQITGKNWFGYLGARTEIAMRGDKFRASGPFAHAILAGTTAALFIPAMVSLWNSNKILSRIGLVGCTLAVLASYSSGPLMTTAFVCFGLWFWNYGQHLKAVIWGSVAMLVLLHLVMKAPVWYLIARIDFTGGSTGYHRARLIDAAVEHLNEWWLRGTGYTRHWMPSGVSWSADHTDITNHYLSLGVRGGLPLMLVFIWILVLCFNLLTSRWRAISPDDPVTRFRIWALGASMFGNVLTMISVTYFDQSSLMIFGLIGLIGSGCYALANSQQATFNPSKDWNSSFDSVDGGSDESLKNVAVD